MKRLTNPHSEYIHKYNVDIIIMISIKNIDLLDIKIVEDTVYYKNELLLLKTGILNAINCSQR